MQLRIFLQRLEYNFQRDQYSKNKTKIALPYQYSMYFPGKYSEVIYILFYIDICIGNFMDSGKYVCGLLYYNTGTWWNCDYDTITKYSGYPNNLYDNVSKDHEKTGEISLWMDQIGLCQYYIFKNKLLHTAHTNVVQGNHYPNRWNILRRE